MKKRVLIFVFLIVFLVGSVNATTYYVDALGGDDGNEGLSESSAWKTISKINSMSFSPGDNILFKRGEIWREQLIPHSGNQMGYITYGAFGTGPKPLILGSVEKNDVSDWTNDGGNIWTTSMPIDIGNIIFDHEQFVGVKVWDKTDLDVQGEFWYDEESSELNLYSTTNPAQYYTDIECALTSYIINEAGKSYVIYENLDLRYGGAHGIGGSAVHQIIIRNCDFSYIGGGKLSGTTRYGNGIEFIAGVEDVLVERCRLWEIYDSALTNQNLVDGITQCNIRYHNNIIWNSEYCYEFWSIETATVSDIYFENNVCCNAGGGWGHTQRPSATGRHIFFGENYANLNNIYVRNNIFYDTALQGNPLYISSNFNYLGNVVIDYNIYYNPLSGNLAMYQGTYYWIGIFSTYQSDTGKDEHSIAADPFVVDVVNHDFHLQSGSPAIDAGTDVGLTQDFDGNPIVGLPDIGAFEYQGMVSTCSLADTDRDGVVSMTELMNYIADWKAGSVLMTELMTAIGEWKNGC